MQRVGRGQRGQQPALVLEEVEDANLALAVRCLELAAGDAVAHRDGDGDLRCAHCGAGHADPALHERAEHGEEPPGLVLDRAGVCAVLVDAAVTVEKGYTRDTDLVEGEPAVVDAVEAGLVAAVLDRDARTRVSLVIADRHEQRVHAVALVAGHQLREDHGDPPMARGIADVVLDRVLVGRLQDELAALGVVRRRRADRLDVGAMTGLGHREASGQLEAHHRGKEALVVVLGAEMQDRAAEQAPLHAGLHQQGQVTERLGLECGDGGTYLAVAAELLGEQQPRAGGGGQLTRLLEDAITMLVDGHVVDRREQRSSQGVPHLVANPRPSAVEERPDLLGRRRRAACVGAGRVVGHVGPSHVGSQGDLCPVASTQCLRHAHGRPWTRRSHDRPWDGLEAQKEGVEPFVGGIRPEPSPPLPPVIGADSSEVTGRTGAGAGTSIGGTAGEPLVDLRAVDLRAVDLRAVDLRAVVLRAPVRLAVDRFAVDLRAVDLRAVAFFAVRFAVDFFAVPRLAAVRFAVPRFAVDLRVVFLAVRFAVVRLAVPRFAVDFFAVRFAVVRLAVPRFAVDLLAVRFAVVRLAVPRFAVDLFAVLLRAVLLRAVVRLAVDFLAVERFAVDFLAVRLAVDFRAVDFFAVDLRAVVLRPAVLRAPVDFFAVLRLAVDFRALFLAAAGATCAP